MNHLAGEFTGIIIGTFGVDLDFTETQLWPLLANTTASRLVLADSRELEKSLRERGRFRKLNRTYVAAPVQSRRAHHPKYLMLLGPSSGRLFVGSGNIGVAGYAGPGECFTAYEWDVGSSSEGAQPFGAVRELIDVIGKQDLVGGFITSKCFDLWKSAQWVPDTGGKMSPVVNNVKTPLLDQLIDRIGKQPVIEVVAAAPFHDRKSLPIQKLIKELRPKKFSLLVQNGQTRLNKQVLRKMIQEHGNFEIVEASLGSSAASRYIHAKFILVRTLKSDFLLQGSANLSGVALCETIEKGNIEIANLLKGNRGDFDHILSTLTLVGKENGLDDFDADENWPSDDLVDRGTWAIRDVVWAAPRLTGVVRKSKPKVLRITIDRAEIKPLDTVWIEHDHHWEFRCTFGLDETEDMEQARGIEIQLDSSSPQVIYPYHAITLNRLASGQTKVDLLQQVGNLDLGERELIELLRELDRIMIVDRQSLWKASNQDYADEGDLEIEDLVDESSQMKYEDIDWSVISNLSQFKQHELLRRGVGWDAGDLSIILSSLASRLRSNASGRVSIDSEGIDYDDDLAREPLLEDEDVADQLSLDIDDELSVDTDYARSRYRRKTRMMWKRFIKRFIRGLNDDKFVEHVGSAVIVPTYVIFNSLCQRLRVKGIVEDETLTELQLDLWKFMWGKPGRAGYLDSLEVDELTEARRILSDYGDLPVLIAAIDDAWWWAWEMDDGGSSLRRMWCHILESKQWLPNSNVLSSAADLSQNYSGDPDSLLEDLQALALHTEKHEFISDMAALAGVKTSEIRLTGGSVMSNGEYLSTPILEISTLGVAESQVVSVINEWIIREPERSYFRVQSEDFMAFVDSKHQTTKHFDKTTGIEKELDLGKTLVPLWKKRLDALAN